MDAGMMCLRTVKEEGMCIVLAFAAPCISQRQDLQRGPLAIHLGHPQSLVLGVTIVWMPRARLALCLVRHMSVGHICGHGFGCRLASAKRRACMGT